MSTTSSATFTFPGIPLNMHPEELHTNYLLFKKLFLTFCASHLQRL
jgi:hypothetical protein